ncbi:MAG: glycoside hydrolase family 16 protein, partial [Pseudomonadota bacterium]
WSRTACGGFHTHSLHWTPDRILIAVDGKPYFHYPKEDKRYRYWPFDRPHHLILNIAVGGWGGRKGIDPEAFPARMEVDYVRVYQRSDDR